ncbi:hypothetical protein BKA67DRAFT_143333 [Truncatella angustata]|uniref:Zn(2)-C6 fungal-type domain-containing protein n=1 Tax=Truncatella angustata TaxID=152316 RepID=A0A9P8UBA6_9PEZI|nr:uncharacterized protein BKA67DRAFT_143333 [Truncatella angustata]KAH6638529.1 hypothetical protein BKA67DRAFT_143333 [Truncatella angustata]
MTARFWSAEMAGDPQPVRRRTFACCKTCRRRHAKCDEAQPECSTCQRLGLSCGGYEPRLLWIMGDAAAPWTTTELRESHRGGGFRYPLFPVVRRQTTSRLEQSMSNRSPMSALLQIDC